MVFDQSQVGVSHTPAARFIHWTFIPLYVYGIIKQVGEIGELENRGLLIFESVFASTFLLIVLLRLTYMRRFKTFHGASRDPHRVHAIIAKSVHAGIYTSLIMLPLSGLAIAWLYSRGIKDGLLQDGALALHEFSASLSYVMIATHVSAAIYSRAKGEGIWSSMVPVLKERGPSENRVVIKIATIEKGIYDRIEELVIGKGRR